MTGAHPRRKRRSLVEAKPNRPSGWITTENHIRRRKRRNLVKPIIR